jgi:dTDP-glucose pyrophosphorylase
VSPSWRDCLILPDAAVLDAIRVIDHTLQKVAVVVDKQDRLLGMITDGDVRRAILSGVSLDASVEEVMSVRPRAASVNDSPEFLAAVMRNLGIRHLPILDYDDRVVGLETLEGCETAAELPNPVVLMAGGLGTRLRPLTAASPKPLVWVGERPMLETILHEMSAQGFRTFYISIRYLGDQIREHFGDGERFSVRIEYLQEEEQLGTAGALGLLPERPTHPVVVANGDVLTKLDYRRLLADHAETGACATVCVSEHAIQVPYGVVEIEGRRLRAIREKPEIRSLVNAGIYVLSPEVLARVPAGQRCEMTDLVGSVIDDGGEVIAFPIREYWRDVGRLTDLERVEADFGRVFR